MLAATATPENVDPAAEKMADSAAAAPPLKKQAVVAPLDGAPLLRVRRLTEAASLPVRGSALAAGYDVASAEDAEVPARGKALVATGLVVAVPEGTYGRVAPRSGLAWKHFIDVGAGVIDADYRGELKVLLFNHSDVAFKGESLGGGEKGGGGGGGGGGRWRTPRQKIGRSPRDELSLKTVPNPPPPPPPPKKKKRHHHPQSPRATASRSWCSSASPRPRSSRTPTWATRRAARAALARRAWRASRRPRRASSERASFVRPAVKRQLVCYRRHA